MNRTQLIRSALAAGLVALALQASGQDRLEIIALRYRVVDQVLPALRPLLEPGGTLSGQGNQLIVRASPGNLAELKRALDAIDRPLRRLQISVRFDEALDAASQSVAASGRIGNRGARLELRGQDSQSSGTERVDQRIQVLEGGHAFIMSGPSSLEAMPRLAGDTVLLDIAPRRETLDQQQPLATTVSAPLGEWFEVGGAATSANREARGIGSASRSRSTESRRVWLKVEEIRP